MKSNHQSPIWPYLIVLAGLFVLSVTAPRGWRSKPGARSTRSVVDRHAAARPATSKDRATVLHAEATPPQHGARRRMSENEPEPKPAHASLFRAETRATKSPAETEPAPFVESANDSDLHFSADRPARADVLEGATGGESFVSLPIDERVGDEAATDGAAERASEPEMDLTAVEPATQAAEGSIDDHEGDQEADDDRDANFDLWPVPVALVDRLERLKEHHAARAWADDISALIARLAEVRVDDAAAVTLLGELRLAATEGAAAVRLPPPAQRRFEQAALDLVRRLELWEKAAPATSAELVSLRAPEADMAMHRAVADVQALVSAAPVGETWRSYLLLSRLDRLATDSRDQAVADRRHAAKTVLRRMIDPRLSTAQRRFLAQPPLAELKRRLRGWAIEPLAVGELLHTVEDYEQARVASLGRTLAEQAEVLSNSRDATERRFGCELARQYRNANLRLVVARDLLNRLLPEPRTVSERVQDTIAGVEARGNSSTTARLSVRLFPAADRIRLGIEAAGVVDSNTASTAGPVTFLSQGESQFRVGKLLVIDSSGLRLGNAMAEANNRTRLSGMETDFDGIPFVRSLVRGYALAQHDEKQGQAQYEVEAKVAGRASERLDAEVTARLAQAESEYRRRFLAPLERLELNPSVVQLSTTEDRITARLRLAGDDQSGAHTPRPLAMSNSLASLQIHESAFNNALARFRLAGRTFTLPELYQWISERSGRTQLVIPDDLPDDVTITFAEKDPVRVRCIEGRVEITLSIAELDQGRRYWSDFQITVYYRPRYEGLRLEFAREGPVELGGENYAGRTEIVLRGIFAKVFAPKRTLAFEPKIARRNSALGTLEFSSALVDNGWISVTVADGKR